MLPVFVAGASGRLERFGLMCPQERGTTSSPASLLRQGTRAQKRLASPSPQKRGRTPASPQSKNSLNLKRNTRYVHILYWGCVFGLRIQGLSLDYLAASVCIRRKESKPYLGVSWFFGLWRHSGLQASRNFLALNTLGGAKKFSTVQGGIRYVF